MITQAKVDLEFEVYEFLSQTLVNIIIIIEFMVKYSIYLVDLLYIHTRIYTVNEVVG